MAAVGIRIGMLESVPELEKFLGTRFGIELDNRRQVGTELVELYGGGNLMHKIVGGGGLKFVVDCG